ncbi:hypothetical protein WN943_000049 [Citrus x changshan-huyou]
MSHWTALPNLRARLDGVSKDSSAGFKIRKVPEHLRTENVKAYEPQIIAIGPLNHHLAREKTHLAEMERHKVLYLKNLLERSREFCGDLLSCCCERMGLLEERARCCYAEPIEISGREFVGMLVLDACFIVELFRRFKLDLWDDDNNVLRTSWIRKKLGRDLLVADNQLPLFVLQEFYYITKMHEDEETNFKDLILGFFSKRAPGFLPLPHEENWNFIISATNLKEAGVKFEKIERDSLFSIDFDKDAGIMKIPALAIDDDTESFFRNISVYEQFFPFCAYAPFINYLKFMDCLINTAKDVELLCENKILHNCLGDDEVVANMFNRLGDSVALPLYNSYGGIFHNVNDCCDRHWNRWIANLRHNYFNTPWAIISVFAALFLLILTLTQTLFSVLAYFQ